MSYLHIHIYIYIHNYICVGFYKLICICLVAKLKKTYFAQLKGGPSLAGARAAEI